MDPPYCSGYTETSAFQAAFPCFHTVKARRPTQRCDVPIMHQPQFMPQFEQHGNPCLPAHAINSDPLCQMFGHQNDIVMVTIKYCVGR